MELVRYADRPDLREARRTILNTFPEFMNHNAMGWKYWGRLYDEFPAFQLALVDDGALIGELHALPVPVMGDELPQGWDEAFERGMEAGRGNVLSLLAISVDPARRGGGVATRLLEAARTAAGAEGLESVIAPVRPTLKERYPLIPIEQYVEWRRDDGRHFDPWIAVHERAGGAIVRPAPRSMRIEAPVAEWEEWTQMRFPGDGTYVVPGMLATLEVHDEVGTHVEPNVWLRHSVF
jgi:GNAT superfamily N-acetyltransferase